MDWRNNPRCVFTAGFAFLPKGSTLYEVEKMISCALVIDRDTEIIEDVSFGFLTPLPDEFLGSIIKGKCVKDGIEPIVGEIEGRFFVAPQKAIIQSFRAAYERYCEMNTIE